MERYKKIGYRDIKNDGRLSLEEELSILKFDEVSKLMYRKKRIYAQM